MMKPAASLRIAAMSGFPGRACGVEKRDRCVHAGCSWGLGVGGHLGQGGDGNRSMLRGAALQAG
jgi:hypothetical protein